MLLAVAGLLMVVGATTPVETARTDIKRQMELERMQRALWGDGREAWAGEVFESAKCNYGDKQCVCVVESDPFKTIAIGCGKGHVMCDVPMATYGTSTHGSCSASPFGTRVVQQGNCVTSDAAGGCSARTVVTKRCKYKSHCLLNRCTMLPPMYPVAPCMANATHSKSTSTWGVLISNCVPKEECMASAKEGASLPAGGTKASKTYSSTRGSLRLAAWGSSMNLGLSHDDILPQRLAACPHAKNCPSCACAFKPSTTIASTKDTFVLTYPTGFDDQGLQAESEMFFSLKMEVIGQLPIASRMRAVVKPENSMIDAFFFKRGQGSAGHNVESDSCGDLWLEMRVRPILDAAIMQGQALSKRLSVTVSIAEDLATSSNSKSLNSLAEIKIAVEPPPAIIIEVRDNRKKVVEILPGGTASPAQASVGGGGDGDQKCIVTAGHQFQLHVRANGVAPLHLVAESGRPDIFPSSFVELQNASSSSSRVETAPGNRDSRTYGLLLLAQKSGTGFIHLSVQDGNSVKVSKMLECVVREPPRITVLDEIPAIISEGHPRDIHFLVSGIMPLRLSIESRVQRVLAQRHLKYDSFPIDSAERKQVLLISSPTVKQIGRTSLNMTLWDGNGASVEVNVVCEVVARPVLVPAHSQMTLTRHFPYVLPITVKGYRMRKMTIDSTNNTVIMGNGGVVLQSNDDGTHELHITAISTGKTELKLVVEDGNGAMSIPISLKIDVQPPPKILVTSEFKSLAVVKGEAGDGSVEVSVEGVGPLDLKVLSSNIDVLNPSVKQQLQITGVGGRRTIRVRPVSKKIASTALKFLLTDANGAVDYASFQIDVIVQKKPSSYQKWKERMKGSPATSGKKSEGGFWRL